MKWNKILLTVLMLLLILVLVACGQNKENIEAQVNEPPAKTPDTTATNTPTVVEPQVNEAAEFYKGKTLTFIVPYSAGGGFDAYARSLVPLIKKYADVDTVVVENVTGGGGVPGTNAIWDANPDGLTIAILNTYGTITSELGGINGVKWKANEFNYLARIAVDRLVLAVNTKSPFQTVDDLFNSKEPIRLGTTSKGGQTYTDTAISMYAIGAKTEIIPGYDGSSDLDRGILGGEIDGSWLSWASKQEFVASGDMRILAQAGRDKHPDLQDIPTYYEIAAKAADAPVNSEDALSTIDALYGSGRSLVTVPGVSQDKVDFLREVFEKALQDEEFLKVNTDQGRPVEYASGNDIQKIVEDMYKLPEATIQLIRNAIKGDL